MGSWGWWRSWTGGRNAPRRLAAPAVLFALVAAGAVTALPAAPPGAATAGAAAAGAAARFAPVPGPFAVEAMNLDWFDQDRNRQVPVRVYFPRREPGPFPVVVFSSGLGAGRASFEFLGRHLASHGYISLHVQHLGSDDQLRKAGGNLRESMLKAARDPRMGLTRLLDLVFALDQVGALATSSPVLRGRIDLEEVAVGGNNLGAWTALAAAGLAFTGKDGEETSLPDPRVKAALLFAPPAAAGPQLDKLRFEHVKVPCLHLTGALGGAKDPAGNGGRQDLQEPARRAAFDRISGVDQLLVMVIAAAVTPGGGAAGTAAGAAGAGSTGGALAPERDAALQGAIKAVSTAFLDAYLRHDAAARDWLRSGGLAAWLGARYRVETRAK
jgi:predicted dienelactone hydrolase